MSEWVGFSDADLRRMKGEADAGNRPEKPKILKPVTGGKSKPISAMGQRQQRKTNPKGNSKQTQKTQGNVPPGALLSKPPPKDTRETDAATSPPGTPNDQIPLHGKTFSPVTEPAQTVESNTQDVHQEPEIVEDKEVIEKKEKLKLEDIQRRQKEMEEKNKRKKSMLTKAIAERKKKAFAESTKLVKIQSELAKLDDMLNYDVSILRDKIDGACWEFNNARKRFEKAETEYVEAKFELHKATEMKEELTEHLYHLIQLNEERKANKLEELMHKLDMEDQEEGADNDEVQKNTSMESNSTEAKTDEVKSPDPTASAEGEKDKTDKATTKDNTAEGEDFKSSPSQKS